MPTPSGLPKAGEVWERTYRLPPDYTPTSYRFTVLERGRGDYWSLRVRLHDPGPHQNPVQLFVDPAYWFSQGELTYIGKWDKESR